MATNIAIRLQAEGSAEIKRVFDEAGNAGKTAFDGVTNAMDRTGAEADQVVRKVREATEAARVAQTSANTATGPSSPRAPAPSSGSATTAQINRIRSQLDDEYRTQAQAERAGRLIAQGEGSGQFTASYADRLRTLADRKYGPQNDNKAEGLNTYDKLFVKYQLTDSAQQLYSGASPSLVALQQGGQVFQQLSDREGGLTAGLKALGVSAAGLVTPFTVAATAGVALGAAFLVAATQSSRDQEVLEKATKGIGAATGATASQLDALARSNAEAGKVSTSTAREIVAGYASTGQIAVPVIGELTRLTSDYARITGQDATSATAELSRAFSDLTTGADVIAAKIGGLDDKTKQLIQTQLEQGDRSAAQATAADYLKASVDANTSATTGWAAAWDRAKSAADGYWEAAKRIAGIKLGIAPEGAQEAVDRLQKSLDSTNANRKFSGMEPLGLGSPQVAERDAAALRLDTERRIAEGRAAEERANQASRSAGDVARAVDPNYARLEQLRTQQSSLRDVLADPLARSRLADQGQVEDAYTSITRAIATLTDATGKMISSEEMARRADQLRIDTIKAKTDAEKASVAERQKAFDLIGKTVTPGDARGQIERAGAISRASADAKSGGSDKEAMDDYDRALKQTENTIRRQQEQSETYGQSAEAVARYRTETELLTAAKRAERDITPELTAQIKDYADRAGEAAKRNEELREATRTNDLYRSAGSDGLRTFISDIGAGKSATDAWTDAVGRLKQRFLDMASDNITDLIFGRRGSSSSGLLGSLLSGSGSDSSSSGGGFFSAIGTMFSGGSAIPRFAAGVTSYGLVTGPGSGTSDNILAMISNGESIVTADATRRHGPLIRAMNENRLPHYAGGYTKPGAASGRASDGGGMNVVINEAPGGDKAQTRMERGPSGDMRLVVDMLSAKQAGDISASRGPLAGAISGGRRLRG